MSVSMPFTSRRGGIPVMLEMCSSIQTKSAGGIWTGNWFGIVVKVRDIQLYVK